MLDFLGGGNESSIDAGGIFPAVADAAGFEKEGEHGVALAFAGLSADSLKNALDADELLFCFGEMAFENFAQIFGARNLDHPRESFEEKVLHMKHVTELFQE